MHRFVFRSNVQVMASVIQRFAATLLVMSVVECAIAQSETEPVRENPRAKVLERALERFPEADANHDGTLTDDEYRNHVKKLRRENPRAQRGSLRQLKLPEGARHESVMLPVRDGVKLATEVIL